MSLFTPIKPIKKPRIGLYSTGLRAYWEQFPGLRERLVAYGEFIGQRLAAWGEVSNFGLVDTEGEGHRAGEWLQAQNVDIVFCHAATYSTSSNILPVHQHCGAPVVFLNLQPTARIDYLFVSRDIQVGRVAVRGGPETSDHLVVLADLTVPG